MWIWEWVADLTHVVLRVYTLWALHESYMACSAVCLRTMPHDTAVCEIVPAFSFCREVTKNFGGKGTDTVVCVTPCLLLAFVGSGKSTTVARVMIQLCLLCEVKKKNHHGKGSITAVRVTVCLFLGGEEEPWWQG